jgi:hypothetical protein
MGRLWLTDAILGVVDEDGGTLMTRCDRFWLRVNRNYVLALFVTLPLALLRPWLALGFVGVALFVSCRTFLVFGSRGDGYDALRFMTSMPFSRREVFVTYMKGIFGLGGGYVLVVVVLRGVLAFEGVDLFFYGVVLFVSLMIVACLQLGFLRAYSRGKFYGLMALFLLVVYPGLYGLYHLKVVLRFVSAVIMYLSYEGDLDGDAGVEPGELLERFTNLGMSLEAAQWVAVVCMGLLAAGFVALFIGGAIRVYKRFCGGKRYVEASC